MTTPFIEPLWPASYGLPPDHCRSVVDGTAYNVPYDPLTSPVILDLGANVGGFLRWAVKRWPMARLHAYEPHPGNFELLKRTREEMLPNESITLHQVAVSDKSGHATLRFNGVNCGEWTLMDMAEQPNEKWDVGRERNYIEVKTISALELPKADILKIDVEGAEVLILGTLKERIAEFSAVMLECHAASIVGPIKGMLARAGFLMTSEKVHSEHRVELCFVKLSEKQTVATLPIIPPIQYPAGRAPVRWKDHRKRVLITCSAKSGTPWWWFKAYDSVMRLKNPEYNFEFAMDAGNTAVNVSRNIAAQTAIDGKYDKLVQIDSDNFWEPEILIRLVSHPEQIVAAPYCKKRPGPVKWLMVAKPGAVMREDGMLECDFMGTGMLSTEVSALKQMVDFFPERRFVYEDEDGIEKEMTELFPIGLVGPNTPEGRLSRIREVLASGGSQESAYLVIKNIVETINPEKARLLGEDYSFSHLARKAGLQLWCDTKNVVGHVGDIVFPIGPDKLSVAAGIPTHNLKLDAW